MKIISKMKVFLGMLLFAFGMSAADSPGYKGPILAFVIVLIGLYLLSTECDEGDGR